jgi:outer membrane immunogenic protein
MKTLTRFLIVIFACTGLALTTFAGPEPIRDYKDKVVAPVPPPCNWQGFYIGLHAGGEFGRSGVEDLDGYNVAGDRSRFDATGVVLGGQAGYNFQWRWLVLGLESDLGYMDLDGKGVQPASPDGDTIGHTESDFYGTFRNRIGFAPNEHWLFYTTGGGIVVNYETSVRDTRNIRPAGPDRIDATNTDFNWGWVVGAGMEYKFNCHWSLKAEYLYYQLEYQNFHAVALSTDDFAWRGTTDGNIGRVGINYHF